MRRLLALVIIILTLASGLLWHYSAGRPAVGPIIAMNLPRSIDPVVAVRQDELRLVGALFEPLVRLDPLTLAPLPALASSWSTSEDGLTWIFHLRPGACWSDGSIVTSADVVRGLQRHLLNGSPYASLLSALIGDAPDALTCPDVQTVVVRIHQRWPDPLLIVSLPLFVPASVAHDQAGRGGLWSDPVHLIGNGPMICVDYCPRHHYDLAPNPAYQGPHRAQGPLRVLIIEDPGCAQRLYLDGAVDAILSVQPDAIRDFTRAQKPGLQRSASFSTEFLRVRFRDRPHGDPKVTAALAHPRLRMALARSIDREILCREVMDGMGVPATTSTPVVISQYMSYHPPHDFLAFNPDQARADLASAIADLGPIPEFEVLAQSTPRERLRSIEYVVDSWRRILGISVRMVVKPSIEMSTQEKSGDFDLSRGTWLGDYLDPTTFLDTWRNDAGINRGCWSDADYDALLNAATQSSGEQRWTLLEQAEKKLMEKVPLIPLMHATCNMLIRPGLKGIAPNALELVWLDQIYWSPTESRENK